MDRDIISAVESLSPAELGEVLFDMDRDYYSQKPVSIREFCTSTDFLGGVFEGEFLEFWKKELDLIYPNPVYSPFFEVITLLPIGSGKTTTANVSVLYEIYKLLCLKNPHAYYKIRPEGVQIVFSLFSAAKTLAEDVNWASMESMLDGSPWFRRYCPLPSTRKVNHEKGTCDLAKNVGIKLGSVSGHAIGMAVFGGVLDEADFQRQKSQQAKTSYLAILRRMESRFLQRGGVIPGKLWLLSSPKHATDFLEDRIKESAKARRTRVIRDTPIWVIRKDRGIFSSTTFRVFIGDTTRDPAILEPGREVDPDLAARTIDVPIELRDSFEKDLLASLNDHAGVSTASSITLIKHPSKLAKVAVLKGRFRQEILELDFEDPGDMIENYTDMSYFRNPDSPESFRFLHLDLGVSNDKLGFACVYAVPKQYEVRGAEKGSRLGRGRQYILDFLLSIRAKKGQEILIRKLEDFVLSLKAARYPIRLITTDQYQSTQFRQTLKLAGIPTGTLSVDGTRDPFLALRSSIYGEAILLSDGPLLTRELLELRDDGKKIDHPAHGSKDASDGLAGAHWNCANAEVVYSQIAFKPDEDPVPRDMSVSSIMDMMVSNQQRSFVNKLYPKL